MKSENKLQILEIITKILQNIAIIVGVIISVITYQQHNLQMIQEQQRFTEAANRQFKVEFYSRQLDYYAEICQITSTIANCEKNSQEFKVAKSEFWKFYWGKLCMVETAEVETQMIEFGKLLNKYEAGEINNDLLKQSSIKLARLSRNHVLKTWLTKTETIQYN